MVQTAVALGPQRRHELRHQRADRNDHAGLPRRRLHDPEVLVVQVDPEAGIEAAGQHAGGLPIQDRVAGQTTGEYLDRGLHVDAVCLEEDDRLRDELNRAGDDELVGRLDGLAGTGRANVHDRLAHRLQHRPG